MKGLNLEGFKKVAEDEKSTTLQHPKGHQIVIAKGALSKPMRGELEKLPLHKAEGGSIDSAMSSMGIDESKDVRTPNNPDYTKDAYSRWDDIAKNLPTSPNFYDDSGKFNAAADAQSSSNLGGSPLNTGVDDASPSASQIADGSKAAPGVFDQPVQQSTMSTGMGGFGMPQPNQMPQGVNQAIGGINQMAQAQSQMAQAQAKAAADQQSKLQDLMGSYQKNLQGVQADIDNTMNDVKNGHIDPKHYVENMSTGQKVGTAIGLILGGLGAGLTHGQNPALAFLNSQIDRDIDSQKADLGKRETLLSANFKRFGNMQDAMLMTKAMQQEIYATKVAQAAAQAGSQEAMGRAQVLIGQLKAPYQQAVDQLAQRQALMGAIQGGQMDPAQAVPLLVPKEHQAKALEEIGKAQNAAKAKAVLSQKFDQAAGENTIARTGAGLLRTPESMQEMRALVLPLIHDSEGRVNEFEQKTVENLLPQPGDTDKKIAQKKEGLMNFLAQKSAAPTAKAYGIDLNRFQSTSQDPLAQMSPQAQQYVQWARQNPHDERSAIILKKLGVK